MTLLFLCFLCWKKTCSHSLLFKMGYIFSGYEIGHRLFDLVETRRVDSRSQRNPRFQVTISASIQLLINYLDLDRLLNTFKVTNINEIYFKYLCTDMKQTLFKREKRRSTNSSTSATAVNKEKPLINKTKMHFTVSLINIKSWDYQKI